MPPLRANRPSESKSRRPSLGVACGKVILLGEHAVVYGVPAIAVGMDRGSSPGPRRRNTSRIG